MIRGSSAQVRDDPEVVVLQDVLGLLPQRGDDHGVEHARAQHVAEERGRAVDHEVHALPPELRDARLAHRGGEDRLAREFLDAEGVELVHGGHDHGRLAHGAAKDEALPLAHGGVVRDEVGHAVGDDVRAARVELQGVDRAEHLRHAQLQQGIGELEVGRVLGEGLRELVVRQPGEEEDAGVVEVVAQLRLDVAQGPLLEDVAQARPGGDGHAGDGGREARALPVHEALRADGVGLAHHAHADGVGLVLPLRAGASRPAPRCGSCRSGARPGACPGTGHGTRSPGAPAPRLIPTTRFMAVPLCACTKCPIGPRAFDPCRQIPSWEMAPGRRLRHAGRDEAGMLRSSKDDRDAGLRGRTWCVPWGFPRR